MPIIKVSQLSRFQDLDGNSHQKVKFGRLENKPYYFKQPPQTITDSLARLFFIINEALNGQTVVILNLALGCQYLTPTVQFVVGEKATVAGILTGAISYQSFADQGANRESLKAALQLSGFAQMIAIRYFLKDLDGHNNIGCGKAVEDGDQMLSSIDYGSANCLALEEQGAMPEEEQEYLLFSQARDIFKLTPEAIFGNVVGPTNEIKVLSHQVFSSFDKDILFLSKSDKALVSAFFSELYKTYTVMAETLTEKNFIAKLKNALDFNELREVEQPIFDKIANDLVLRAQELKSVLRRMSQFSSAEFRQILNGMDEGLLSIMVDAFQSRQSPRLLKRAYSLRTINSLLIQQALEECQKSSTEGRISPANGGGNDSYGCYKEILSPQKLSRRFSKWSEVTPIIIEEDKESQEDEEAFKLSS